MKILAWGILLAMYGLLYFYAYIQCKSLVRGFIVLNLFILIIGLLAGALVWALETVLR